MARDHQRRHRRPEHQVTAAEAKAGKGERGKRRDRDPEHRDKAGDDQAVDQIAREIELADGAAVIVQCEVDPAGIEGIRRLERHPDGIEDR